jgi:peptidyl-prolyl cis-trans isomerase C
MISVNGVTIDDAAVAREIQHHPAPTRDEAERSAATALVVRELLVQRARERGVAGASEDERIANLIEMDVHIPQPTDEEVARYYRRNTLRFMTSPLYEAAHIFFPAHADDDEKRAEAKAKAEAVLAMLERQPGRFAELAKAHSACSSKDAGGSLGQVTRGDTNPELERAMATMEIGAILIVASRHGCHVLRLDRRVAAKELPLEQVRPRIEEHLRGASRRRAISQYLQLLAAGAEIRGVDMAAADSPLVQ